MSTRSSSPPVVAIVGATGAVGVEFLHCLERLRFPLSELRLLASARSAGKTLSFKSQPLPAHELTENSFRDVDIALFSAGSSIAKRFGPIAVRAGAVAVDNSSAFPQRPASGAGNQSPSPPPASRHHRQPQLLDHHRDYSTLADPQG
jgi:aspartate-semialdehyde dehydrogenase